MFPRVLIIALPATAFDFSLIAKNREQDLSHPRLPLEIKRCGRCGR
jgi:hypothetical protein